MTFSMEFESIIRTSSCLINDVQIKPMTEEAMDCALGVHNKNNTLRRTYQPNMLNHSLEKVTDETVAQRPKSSSASSVREESTSSKRKQSSKIRTRTSIVGYDCIPRKGGDYNHTPGSSVDYNYFHSTDTTCNQRRKLLSY